MNYKEKWFAIIVIFLLTGATLIPTITADPRITSSEKPYVEAEKIFNELKVKLDKVTTKQEALVLVNEAIVDLHKYGFLPKGMSVRQAQRLVTVCFSKSELLQPSQKSNLNNTGNINCLVVGIATETYFRPYPSLVMDIPIIEYLVFDSNFSKYFNFLAWFYAIRVFTPVKFGPYAYVGNRYKAFEDGNLTDKIYSSSGFVWTIGANGIKKWNGSFYGGLYTKYMKAVNENNSYEIWDAVGIRCFIGINFFNFISFASSNEFPSFYIGFAREINFTYSPPWT